MNWEETLTSELYLGTPLGVPVRSEGPLTGLEICRFPTHRKGARRRLESMLKKCQTLPLVAPDSPRLSSDNLGAIWKTLDDHAASAAAGMATALDGDQARRRDMLRIPFTVGVGYRAPKLNYFFILAVPIQRSPDHRVFVSQKVVPLSLACPLHAITRRKNCNGSR